MNGFTGIKTAATVELPDAGTVMDPSTWWAWPATPWTDADDGSSRLSEAPAAARATRSTPPAAPCTGADRPAHGQAARPAECSVRDRRARPGRSDLVDLPAHDRRLPRTRPGHRPAADDHPHRRTSHAVPEARREVITLGQTLGKRAADNLAYFDRPGTSNGPPRRSTAVSSIFAAPPSDPET